jgi:hypothetical protein
MGELSFLCDFTQPLPMARLVSLVAWDVPA